ncbi:MAG: AbrB/MazE/SpoVT family DNA-binding domain-containing protein [Thermomicrobiales bacterium]
MSIATVDSKGRLSIPSEIRSKLGIEAGDVFFVDGDAEPGVIRIAKAQNPFDALADHAEQEYRAGRTRNLRDYAGDRGIDLDGE